MVIIDEQKIIREPFVGAGGQHFGYDISVCILVRVKDIIRLYVDDAVKTLLRLCRGKEEGVKQVISGNEITVRDMIWTIQELIGAPTDQIAFASNEYHAEISSYLHNVVQCVAPTPLIEGLERTIEWVRKN